MKSMETASPALQTEQSLPQEPKRIYVEGHGCSASFSDTEIIRGMIQSAGYSLVNDESKADLSVLVTCSVKSVTEERMLSRIRSLSRRGSDKLIVAGCLPKADPGKITRIDPNLNMIGPGNLDKLLPAIEHTAAGKQFTALEPTKLVKLGMPRSRLNNLVGIIEISSGCVSSCTFCQVKLVKGLVFSYPDDMIVDEAKLLLSQGAKEIWLTSTDNAAYGRDSKSSLPRLLRQVISIPGDFRVRVGMLNPLLAEKILEDLIDSYKSEKVFKFLHLPVQSGSDRVLKQMQRGYTVSEFEETVSKFRNAISKLTLSTDMIVGFPGESEKDHEDSMELLRRVRPDVVNISRYGARAGTKAAIMSGQIDSGTAKRRSSNMTTLCRELQNNTNSKWIGWTGRALVDERVKNDAYVGRNFAYKPLLFKKSNEFDGNTLGKEVEALVVGSTASTLEAKLLEKN
jgi:threonylcarbamoyladenosine tRNA methylthiotransferase CDKAL1